MGRKVSRGFTLLELSLVLAILVIIASLAWPALRGPLESDRLRRAGDQVRTVCAAARNRAIVTGQTHVLRFQAGSGNFQVQAVAEGDASLAANGTTVSPNNRASFGQVADTAASESAGSIMDELPERVVFQASQTEADLRATSIDATGQWASAADGAAPLLFFSDGTTSTARVTLANDRGQSIVIELRGLTGATRAGPLQSSEESRQ